MSAQDQPAAISAWIFDWDGVFVDSEMWKAWSYGLGICEVWEDFERLEASRFDRVAPAEANRDRAGVLAVLAAVEARPPAFAHGIRKRCAASTAGSAGRLRTRTSSRHGLIWH